MKLKVSAMQAERATSDLFASGSKNDRIPLRQCWISGTTQRTSLRGFGLMTGISYSSATYIDAQRKLGPRFILRDKKAALTMKP